MCVSVFVCVCVGIHVCLWVCVCVGIHVWVCVCVAFQAGWQTEGSPNIQRENKSGDPEEGGLPGHSAAQTLFHSRGKALRLPSIREVT